MNPLNQQIRKIIKLEDLNYPSNFCFTYGIWSKYNPLGKISQIGMYGLFDGYCFHLHNAIEVDSLSLNFIYYDCLDKQLKTIKKTIQFINDKNEQLTFSINIDSDQYENIWYFMQIIQWPQLDRFELLLSKQQSQEIHEIIQMKSPYNDKNLILTFGSNLIVSNSKILNIKHGDIFSYFPGAIRLQEYSEEIQAPLLNLLEIAQVTYESFKTCVCQPNEKFLIEDQDFQDLKFSQYISQNLNCDSFILIGWIQIKKIPIDSKEFIYQFIKISPNSELLMLEDSNLSPFQLFYYISEEENNIEITTYSYQFPDVSSNFVENPFLIKDKFKISNEITQWHQIKVELQFDQFKIDVKFYENKILNHFTKMYNVKQFNNYQIKVKFGNCLQQSKNQLNVAIKNFQFYNCYQQLDYQNCHYSCLTCDGPTNENCLSCSEFSTRIYLQQYKVCICPYNTIDQDGKCKTFEDSNLILQKSHRVSKCQQGYFENERECFICPSIVKKKMITCLECYKNPSNWQFDLTCQQNLYLQELGSLQESIIFEGIERFYFDGAQINYRQDYNKSSFQTNIESIENMYVELRLVSIAFKQFCQQQENIIQNTFMCYLCRLYNCLTCSISITGLECIQCEIGYILMKGQCTQNNFQQIDPICIPPDYLTFQKQCKTCTIKNCILCFEYISYDQDVSSLYPSYAITEDDFEYIKIGCALCKDNYIFDFTLNLCINQISQLKSCQRSFINLDGSEKCTLSTTDDFTIAPEIINCQKYIQNCQQCSLNIYNIIQCIICQNGFLVENNQCFPNEEELPDQLIRSWTSKIQSFMLQFIPSLYTYIYQYYFLPQQIEEGYCDSDCLICGQNVFYYCKKCRLNYFKQQIKVEEGQNCSDCPQLCQVCIPRSDIEIKAYSPKFLVTEENLIYTKKCIKPYLDPAIYFDPYNQVARYCLNRECDDSLIFRFSIHSCNFIRFNRNYESQINTKYCNSIGIQSIEFQFDFTIDEEICYLFFPLSFSTKLKQQIFTLKHTQFKIYSEKQYFIYPIQSTYFSNYDEVQFENLSFIINNNHTFIIDNDSNQINLTLSNIKIYQSQFNDLNSLFETQNYDIINLKNLTISNSIFKNSSILRLIKQQLVRIISISGLYIYNCTFKDSTLFYITKLQNNIYLENFQIQNCTLEHSSIFYFDTQTLGHILINLSPLSVQNNQFYESNLINTTNLVELRIEDFSFKFNYLYNSIIIGLNSKLTLLQILIEKNKFESSQFVIIIQKLFMQTIPCLIQDLQVIENLYQSSNLFRILSTYSTNNLIVNIQNTYMYQNYQLTNQVEFEYLFDINCDQFFLKLMTITYNDNLLILLLQENQKILIENLFYQGTPMDFKIPLSLKDLQMNKRNKLLTIQGIRQTSIINLIVENQINFDEYIIEITQSSQVKTKQISHINIQNAKFQGNIQLLTNQIHRLSLLSIESDIYINILLQNISYGYNIFHSYTNNALRSSASLLYIWSSLGSIEVKDIFCYYNALTNSSNTFVIINSEKLQFINYTIQNQNYLNNALWCQYYDLDLGLVDHLNQENFNQYIFSTLKISNIGGAGKVQASQFLCIDCFFERILAKEGFAFDITTTEEGYISLLNLTVNQAENDLETREKYQGCINVYSTNSKLNMIINTAKFFNIFNRMASSIFTIIPSKIQNYLQIQNVEFENCFSLFSQIMNIQFSQIIIEKNFVILRNIKIIQHLQSWTQYFSKVKNLQIQELDEIVENDNALISISSGSVMIKNLQIQGACISPIMRFKNVLQLSLESLKINNIEIFYQLTLIQIIQVVKLQSKIKFQQIDIQSVSLYETLIPGSSQNFLNENAYQLQQSNIEVGSLLNIQSFSNQSLLYFDQIQLINNNCTYCIHGLMYFEVEEFQEIRLLNINCLFNQIKKFGCLYFTKKKFAQAKVTIQNSNFLHNKGTQGIAIMCVNIYLKIMSSKIIQNSASELGGGIYLVIDQSNYIIKQSIILSNNAKAGGGIYLQGDSFLNKNNFINTQLLFNTATEQGNNLIENPSHLALYINQKEIPSTDLKTNGVQTNKIKLSTYRIIEQGIVQKSDCLIFPSNQIIKDFKIFDTKQSKYKSFIENIQLNYKNSLNELLKNVQNSTCLINQSIVTKNQSSVIKLQNNQVYKLDNGKYYFDLSPLQFTFDPFQQNYEYLQLSIQCKFNLQNSGLLYIINTKSLKCQLGEFYVDEGCQICQSNQGFYSVTYNATKCSIFDKTKFAKISSNMIELLPGYWRPHNLSDFAEICFRNLAFCRGGWLVGNNLCINGHLGALCEECDIFDMRGYGNFYKNQWDQQCLRCTGSWVGIFSILLVIIWTFISIALSLRSINRSNKLYAQLKLVRRFNKILFKLNQDHESILIKMMINYLWTFSAIFTFNINFSLSFQFIEQTSNSSYSLANDIDCQLSNLSNTSLIYLKLITLITFIVSQFNIIFLISFVYFIKINHKFDLSILSNTLLYLYVVNYAGLIKMLSSIISIRVISNINYIQGDVSQIFGDQNHQTWMYYFVLPAIIFFGLIIPVFIFIFLIINQNNLDEIKLRKHICYILNEYQSQSYFWEQIKQFKKALIIFIMTYFETQILLKASLLGLCLLIYQLLSANQKPFIIQKFNSLDLQSGQICSITIFLAAIKYISEQQNIEYAQTIIQLTIIGFFIRLCYPFVKNLFRIYYKIYKIPLLTSLYNLLKLISNSSMLTVYFGKILNQQKHKEQRLQNYFVKLRDYLMLYTKIQLRNTRLSIMNSPGRIHTAKSTRYDLEKILFLGTEEENHQINQ
ncbi:unnamed protein product [Paramecium sonneborni]|uniref:Transmembrane protein n=1 Tax=Paramecium sonneborni TaxID=65129 RepID=A0A8S1NLW0_9CILI|nr:unnamed protein product [Paramecium sonneborni]